VSEGLTLQQPVDTTTGSVSTHLECLVEQTLVCSGGCVEEERLQWNSHTPLQETEHDGHQQLQHTQRQHLLSDVYPLTPYHTMS